MNPPITGCDGCATSGGSASCSIHGGQYTTIGPAMGQDPASEQTMIEKYQKVLDLMAENAKLRAEVERLKKRLAKCRERGFQLMARNMAALIPKLPGGTPGIYDFGRAAGDAVCPKCGLEFVEHPKGMEEYLNLLCDGKQVKL